MKPKAIVTAVIVIALAVFLFSISRSCGVDAKYRNLKLQYDGYKLVAEADHELSMRHIESLTNQIGDMTNKIVGLESEVAEKGKRITTLSTRLDELQAGEPVQPELEKEPLVINLRQQVATLTEMFTLAQGTIDIQKQEIKIWGEKYTAQEQISKEWEASYNREHQLRAMSEDLTKRLERQYKLSRLKGRVTTVACAVALGVVGYQLLK